MYVSLDGGGAESCPTLADSAAVSLSQMAFLSMSVSIFSVVANIANNLNNNNNMNQNIVNQLNIDLPPPVPGKRSAEQTRAYHHQLRRQLNLTSWSACSVASVSSLA